MESPQVSSPVLGTFSTQSSRSRSSTKLTVDDMTSLTSFNPFSEEDENDQSFVTSIFFRMKNTLSAPLASVTAASSSTPNNASTSVNTVAAAAEPRRPSYGVSQNNPNLPSRPSMSADRPNSLSAVHAAHPAPPLVSLTPAQSEVPTYSVEYERSPSRTGMFPSYDSQDGGIFGTSIPGFPIQDDARSVKTTASLQRSNSVSKVIRRIRGEGLSRDYWMDDENCKECYDCESIFTTWRRKHHCRICGQIFCSRCASNIIKGYRFGHDGMIRVCNLCVEKLAKVDEDDDDDRRSVVSSVTSFPAHQLGVDVMSLAHHPQSPFAASQLFGRTDEPFNLYSIAETKRRISGSDESGFGSRPITPPLGEDGVWEPLRENPAPFRRGLSDDEVNVPDPFSSEESPTASGIKSAFEFPGAIPIHIDAPSSIQFPKGSPDHLDSPGPRLRSRFNSYGGDFEVATPFIRSRVQSRLDNFPTVEPGWRTRRESTAYAQELNLTSMLHLKIMLRQMLTKENIPNIRAWEETLLKLALRIARELTFTALPHRQGEDMDVRRYVKIKKIPGGVPSDSEYVDGAVITKNVAHKQMSRLQRNPRVMLVTFPLEFYRVEGQYMHFGQIVRQEKEYLGNLATRIAALRPHVVLVEKSVSRLALDALAKYNIVVARTVKPSAIHAVARMTQSDVFSSMDKLALEPRLGHCARFRIQTYDHPLIPGRRKTYMRFEGCSRDMGCTIILRGEDIDTLRRIKKVTRFLTFIVRNLKLETHLWKDSVITLPSFNADAFPSSPSGRHVLGNLSVSSVTSLMFPSSLSTPRLTTPTPGMRHPQVTVDDGSDEDLPNEDAEQIRLSKRIDQALEPYKQTFISVSATLRFPPPQPIRRMKELDNELLEAKRTWEDEVIRREERGHPETQLSAANTPTILSPPIVADAVQQPESNEDLSAQIEALPTLSIPNTPSDLSITPRLLSPRTVEQTTSYFLPNVNGGFISPVSSLGGSSIAEGSSLVAIPAAEEPEQVLKTVEDIALESKYEMLKWQHEEQRRIWEWYLRKNPDDFVVEKYQCISLWEYVIPLAEFGLHRACFAPSLNYITFYGEKDCTLGQYIEKSVGDTLVQFLDPKAVCTGKGCDQPIARHCKVYVHNETRLFVAVEQWDGQIIGRMNYYPAPDLITTWSACRVCGSATPFIPVSEEMQRYSFAKFLELHFYPADVQLVQGAGCQHNIYQHHIRYFATKGMTVRFQADPITLHEVVYPPFRIRVRPETQLELKNMDFERLHRRNLLWYTGLIDDLKLISIDAATGEEENDARLLADINKLISRAEVEKEDISRLINRIYRESPATDTFALNQVHSYRQDKIVAWQQDFDRLPKPKPSQQLDRNGKRNSAFGSVRSMWPRRYDLAGAFDSPHLPSSSVSEAEEGPFTLRRVTGDSFTSTSSASEAESEPNVDEPSKAPVAKEEVAEDAGRPSTSTNASTVIDSDIKSDPESDSTIGAGKDEVSPESLESPQPDPGATAQTRQQRASRLPRRSNNQFNVAELVRKYQDFLPPQGVHDLAKTAFPPRIVVSESEQEYTHTPIRLGPRSKSRHRMPVRKQSTSDFEQGYAANIAPKYLTHSRRNLPQAAGSRIPGPVGSALQSEESSRRPSPEKRSLSGKGREVRFGRASRPSSPPNARVPSTGLPANAKSPRTKPPGRTRDKTPSRAATSAGSKSTFRKPAAGPGSKVSNIAKHFERLGRDAERHKSRYAIIRGRRARPVASARAKVEVLDSVKDAIKDESDSSDSSSEADDEGDGNVEETKTVPELIQQSSPEYDTPVPEVTETAPPLEAFPPTVEPSIATEDPAPRLPPPGPLSLPPSPFLSSFKDYGNLLTPPPQDLDLANGTERNSILKALSGFWQTPSRSPFEVDDPMNDPEHIFRDSSMIVRTDEPTSIIALALNSPQYRDMLSKSRAEKRTAREAKLTDAEVFMPDDRSVAESTSTWGVVDVDAAELADPTEDLKVASSKLPWAISFESGGLTISCTVLYPEQFDALRRTYDCEKSMIESLARCVKWDASGGKSGSAFLKTRDDRFIAKELSRPELQTMETFAPAYFDYMSSAVSADRPTLLAKIFGCYKLTFKKTGKDKAPSGKSKSTQMNLLVMENLFYDRRFSKLYDLKGSTRNRHVQSTGRENEVLLDENLVQTAHLAPFYLREHSKRILRGALYNDSKFLSDVNVMDYSFLVGVDSKNNELVVGIVDYIRTYTWDKKLESWVKESAFLGGSGRGEPTIITPKQYRQRFLGAMERYFPLIPDRWMKQKDSPEFQEDSHLLELWPDW
ncbi:hypothetical protein C8F04DRAFT_1066996 [Mycena alexandri]|uniref:1-phosphatidylinositol-3-phosphate 5-kinase n=1 Tax=Mycena alexandri TaxID=1745969 RepID=A0AAD6XE25_9AGAR|nr:hypothetical protein C8F04DRAFT_1066996 [Mycena alexandri]